MRSLSICVKHGTTNLNSSPSAVAALALPTGMVASFRCWRRTLSRCLRRKRCEPEPWAVRGPDRRRGARDRLRAPVQEPAHGLARGDRMDRHHRAAGGVSENVAPNPRILLMA